MLGVAFEGRRREAELGERRLPRTTSGAVAGAAAGARLGSGEWPIDAVAADDEPTDSSLGWRPTRARSEVKRFVAVFLVRLKPTPPGFRSSEDGASMLRPLLASEPGDVSELVLQAFMRGLHHAAPGRTYSAPAAIFVWYRIRAHRSFLRGLREIFAGFPASGAHGRASTFISDCVGHA